MIAPDRPRRSALFLPASNARAIAKARELPCDVVILDLEDAVAPEAKREAREAALAAVAEGFGGREVAVRANGLDTPWGADDMAALGGSGVDAVLVPKIGGPDEVRACDAALANAPPSLQLWAMIESCAAMTRLDAIGAAAADTRLALWVLGLNDLAKEMRARLDPARSVFQPLLAQAVCAARAHGIAVLDAVCNEFRDIAVFEAEAAQGAAYGFDGKSLIHPAQIAPANAAFGPQADEVAWAHAVIAAFGDPASVGQGAIKVDGRMVERLHLTEAERLVALAERLGTV